MRASQVIDKLKESHAYWSAWRKEAQEDFNYRAGLQWDSQAVEDLRGVGVKALTLNKIQPKVLVISGFMRQNKTDYVTYPEGEEDGLKADIATRLLKNTTKQCSAHHKLIETFEDGVTCGIGWVEVYKTYEKDFINGEPKLKKLNPLNVFPDPAANEYDNSDGQYIIKITPKLRKETLIALFPKKEGVINRLSPYSLDKLNETTPHFQVEDYPTKSENDADSADNWAKDTYDLVECFYKKYEMVSFGVNDGEPPVPLRKELVELARNEYEAITEKRVARVYVCSVIGNTLLADVKHEFADVWAGWPIFMFGAHRITIPLKNKAARYQGVVRSMKCLQDEINKRSTQELRHINATANSGWLTEEGTWVDPDATRKYGSSPGVNLEYRKGATKPERIFPAPISQGHEQMAQIRATDMKEASGINDDLLASDSSASNSGRAMHIRQQQGMVMIQDMIDNFQETRRILGKFLVTILGTLYTVKTARKVLGESFIDANFKMPAHLVLQQIYQKTQQGQRLAPWEEKIRQDYGDANLEQPILDAQGAMATVVDQDAVDALLDQVLNSRELLQYDVAVGEAISNETVAFSNYMMLADMTEKGVPIPPEVLIETSTLSKDTKEKVKQAIAARQQAVPPQGQQPANPGA